MSAVWLMAAGIGSVTAADSDIVINEIMYHPPQDRDDLQFIELFNRGPAEVDVKGWEFSKGVSFTFSNRTVLPPGGFLVVCRNVTAFTRHYGTNLVAIGNFTGHLSHNGENLELCNARERTVDTLKYADRAPWPSGADGASASLERICPWTSGKDPANWAASALPALITPAGTPGRRNDSFATNLPPQITNVVFQPPRPSQPATVTASVSDADGVKAVSLQYRLARSGGESSPTEVAMARSRGDVQAGVYQAAIPAQPEGALVRFVIRAEDATGTLRLEPAPNELRPTYSYATVANTNQARIAFAYVLNVTRPAREQAFRFRGMRGRNLPPEPARGNGAFIYAPPDSPEVLLFDHVQVRPRSGGFKVHFQSDRPFKGMTGINVISEGPPRWMLSEPLAYELYRQAGVPACLTEHLRTWVDGRRFGYQLLIEQPNRAFLARNGRSTAGNLYKLLWYESGVVGQHEKKTNLTGSHEDIVSVIKELNARAGADQWEFIREHINVDEFINYFAVNMCIQNWDGFFNNYFVYHDTERTKKWEIYPWDEDKTWGDYDGASASYDWYTMPLTFGMAGGDRPTANPLMRLFGGGGPWGGAMWWRPPGWFSGPLLANAEFRQRFLTRLRELCDTVFTEEKFGPVINALEKRLEPEFKGAAVSEGDDAGSALQQFKDDIQSFRNQLKYRRKFILSQLPAKASQETTRP